MGSNPATVTETRADKASSPGQAYLRTPSVGSARSGFKFWCPLISCITLSNHVTSLNLSLLICKVGGEQHLTHGWLLGSQEIAQAPAGTGPVNSPITLACPAVHTLKITGGFWHPPAPVPTTICGPSCRKHFDSYSSMQLIHRSPGPEVSASTPLFWMFVL